MVYLALLPLMRTPRLSLVDWTDSPAYLNGLVRFAKRRNMVSARVPSHFKCSLPSCCGGSTAISVTSLSLLFVLSIFVVMSLHYFVLDIIVTIDLHSTPTVYPLLVYNIMLILYCGSWNFIVSERHLWLFHVHSSIHPPRFSKLI